MLYDHLHVVVSVEGFVANRARELRWTDEDLCWWWNPVLAFNRSSSNVMMIRVARAAAAGGGSWSWRRTNAEGYSDTIFGARVVTVMILRRGMAWQVGMVVDSLGVVYFRDVAVVVGVVVLLARRTKWKENGVLVVFLVGFQTSTPARWYAGEGEGLHGVAWWCFL